MNKQTNKQAIGLIGLNPFFFHKIELSRLNPLFVSKDGVEPAQFKLFRVKWGRTGST